MINLYLTTDTGFPASNCGGSNKIIYEINKCLNHDAYSVRYLSYDLHATMNDETAYDRYGSEKRMAKKIGSSIFKNNSLFRRIVTHPSYYPIHAWKRQKYFQSICSRVTPDIIHAHHPLGFFHWLSTPGIKKILTLHNKGAYVHEMRNSLSNNFFSKKRLDIFDEIETNAFNVADVVTFPSRAAYEMFVETKFPNVLKNDNIEIIYNGIDIEKISKINVPLGFRETYGIPAGARIVLNVANHITFKNIDLLIEAVYRHNAVRKEKLFVVNISTAPMKETEALRNLVSRLKMNGNVKFLFNVQNDDVIRFMKQCCCLVMPGTYVVYDMVILEALASGCYVIVSNNGGNREMIRNGVNGTLLPEISIEAIEICLNHMENEEDVKNKQKIDSSMSSEYMVSQYEKIYSRCLNLQ